MKSQPHVAIVGATGAVGREMLICLSERNFPLSKLTLLASARSAGQSLSFNGEEIIIQELTENSFQGIDIALFSAGGGISEKFGPIAAKAGCVIIDNSSAFRMDPEVPLIVPEINPEAALNHPRNIIANPNCSTIITHEGRKILDLPELNVTCTCVRVPVMRSHSISVTAIFEKDPTVADAQAVFAEAKGVALRDDPSQALYPVPLDTIGQDDCLVGRIRKDQVIPNSLALWVVGDQVRKGAALNAVQIAELL